jgi:hypothetical protein
VINLPQYNSAFCHVYRLLYRIQVLGVVVKSQVGMLGVSVRGAGGALRTRAWRSRAGESAGRGYPPSYHGGPGGKTPGNCSKL